MTLVGLRVELGTEVPWGWGGVQAGPAVVSTENLDLEAPDDRSLVLFYQGPVGGSDAARVTQIIGDEPRTVPRPPDGSGSSFPFVHINTGQREAPLHSMWKQVLTGGEPDLGLYQTSLLNKQLLNTCT